MENEQPQPGDTVIPKPELTRDELGRLLCYTMNILKLNHYEDYQELIEDYFVRVKK